MSRARHDEMVGLVETMLMTADSLQLTAYGPDKDRIRFVEDAVAGSRPTADGPQLAIAKDAGPVVPATQ